MEADRLNDRMASINKINMLISVLSQDQHNYKVLIPQQREDHIPQQREAQVQPHVQTHR